MKIKQLKTCKSFTYICFLLIAVLPWVSCTSYVVIAPNYPAKLRIGDGVKLTMKDGTVYSGRAVYLDQASIVIRTPKQTKARSPVEVARFGTTVPWKDVVHVKVTGTLDRQGKLISNEEIRVNHRSNHRRHMLTNIGLLGVSISFLGAALMQGQVSPTNLTGPSTGHTKGRIAFWSTFILGSAASTFLGYKVGQNLDRQVAITRIERFREQLQKIAEAAQDTLQQNQTSIPPQIKAAPPSVQ
jgi:hypothetical protein